MEIVGSRFLGFTGQIKNNRRYKAEEEACAKRMFGEKLANRKGRLGQSLHVDNFQKDT